jgi:mRNA interferase MazF
VLVNLDPTLGSEMKKTRPCVIFSSSKSYPTRVEVKHKSTKGWIAIDQLRTIDRLRIIKRLGSLIDKEVDKVKSVIQQTFVD